MIRRYERLHYMDTGTQSVVFSLINEGVVSFDDELSPKTETKQYIADQNERDEVISYKPSFRYSAELDADDAVSQKLYLIGANQVVGAQVTIVTVDTWTELTGICEARQATYNVIPSKAGSGAPGTNLTMEGTLSQVGVIVPGYWDVAADEFAESADALINQSVTITVASEASAGGTLEIDVTAEDMSNSPKTVSVPVLESDTAAVVAGKIRAAMMADADVYAFFSVDGTGAAVKLTTRTPAVTDESMAIDLSEADSTGVTFA